MKNNEFSNYIASSNFKELFISELGWNRYRGVEKWLPIEIDEETFQVSSIAERNGFQILTCPVKKIPNITICRKLDARIRNAANDYICIFYIQNTQHHQWIAPIRENNRREIVTIEYENTQQLDFLFSKIQSLTFELDERTTIVDVKERVNSAFAVNSEKITKEFYSGFQKQHKEFSEFISGIKDDIPVKQNKDKQWFASVMLNRLMFCYFIQKKGFLDGDFNYLQNKLKWVQDLQGKNKFFKTFYKGFLSELFYEGLNASSHNQNFISIYGRIPYLNGGMFEEHQLEKEYQNIDINDEAFVNLFNFFDKWRWHLDTRITASGKDINPDVLGYIFEQYVNDRSKMGAYYTKEDITEYISKNCILPFLINKVSTHFPKIFGSRGSAWKLLSRDREKYIYDPMKKGYSENWQNQLPTDISKGLDCKRNIASKRSKWNSPASEDFGLPNETWRESIDRLSIYENTINTIQSRQINNINELITYNLDIQTFVYDLLNQSSDSNFIDSFYKQLKKLSILDPTCGSGAFLFAAMNVLEPLYEICIEKMSSFNEKDPSLFKNELAEIRKHYRSNIRYFIYKNIILRNLYGVDIMAEATEIAKLRLFLKLMAVVDVNFRDENLGLDPLPDIDFNIRSGNSLFGYASENELEKDLEQPADINQLIANQDRQKEIYEKLSSVAETYRKFRSSQLDSFASAQQIKTIKSSLREEVKNLNGVLNYLLYEGTNTSNHTFEEWFNIQKPFHWFAEFYEVLNENKGFDIIIGNPPYLEAKDIEYEIKDYQTKDSRAVHIFCLERSLNLLNENGNISMILPMALTCTQRMVCAQELLEQNRTVWYSNFAWRPAKLFDQVNRALCIFIANKTPSLSVFTTPYIKWTAETRSLLFKTLSYLPYNEPRQSFWVPKLKNPIEFSILSKVLKQKNSIPNYFSSSNKNPVYYKSTGGLYWKVFTNFAPKFYCNGIEGKSSRETTMDLSSKNVAICAVAIFSSNLFWWWYTITSNLRDLNPSDLNGFRFPLDIMSDKDLLEKGKEYIRDIKKNSSMLTRVQKKTGTTETQSFKISLSKSIIDEIDNILAKHYGFTKEELDFINNYDIKYRLGADSD